MNCKYCRANCTGAKHDREIALCLGYDPPKTNGDFIRSMSDEELAVFLHGLVNEFGSMNHDCLDFNYCIIHSGEYRYNGWLDWLRQEAKDGSV